jgi:hypothetical protein
VRIENVTVRRMTSAFGGATAAGTQGRNRMSEVVV